MLGRSIVPLLFMSCAAVLQPARAAQTPAPAAAVQDASAPAAQWIAGRRHAGLQLPADLFAAREGAAAPRVVMVGRALHGTNEIAGFEQAVWTAVNAIGGFDVVAVDVGLDEGYAADAWIHTGQGDLEAIVRALVPWGWSPTQARGLLEALRRRNTEQAAKPVSFVGIGVGLPYPLCDPYASYIRKAYPEGAPRIEFILQALRSAGPDGRPRYARLDDNDRAILQFGLEEALSMTRERGEEYAARTSPAEYAQALARVTALSQYEMTMRFELTGGDRDPRGQILAENTIAALARAGTTARLLVLANVRDLARASDTDSFAAQLESIGQIRPVCIATAVGAGDFSALDPNDHAKGPALPRTLVLEAAAATELEGLLAKSGTGDAVFDLRAPSSALPAWFTKLRALRCARAVCGGVLETPWTFDVARDFDVIAWFAAVHASKPATPK
jgi:erythromycin esterase-like protein